MCRGPFLGGHLHAVICPETTWSCMMMFGHDDGIYFGRLLAFQLERSLTQFFSALQPCRHFLAKNGDGIAVFTTK